MLLSDNKPRPVMAWERSDWLGQVSEGCGRENLRGEVTAEITRAGAGLSRERDRELRTPVPVYAMSLQKGYHNVMR